MNASLLYKESPECQSTRGTKELNSRALGLESQLREHDATPKPGVPDVIARETVDEDVKAMGAHVDAGNEELPIHFEQEECCPVVATKPLPAIPSEDPDLRLRQAEPIKVLTETTEDLREVAILDHLVDSDLGLLRRCGNHIETPVLEVWVDVATENVPRVGKSFLAIRCRKLDRLTARDELESTDHVLGKFREKHRHGRLHDGRDFVSLRENSLEVIIVDNSLCLERTDRFCGRLARRIHDHPNRCLNPTRCNHRHDVVILSMSYAEYGKSAFISFFLYCTPKPFLCQVARLEAIIYGFNYGFFV